MWCTIDSDPGVFTDLISHMGVKGIQVEELYSLDKEMINTLKPVYGLIFLFRWSPNAPGSTNSSSSSSSSSSSLNKPQMPSTAAPTTGVLPTPPAATIAPGVSPAASATSGIVQQQQQPVQLPQQQQQQSQSIQAPPPPPITSSHHHHHQDQMDNDEFMNDFCHFKYPNVFFANQVTNNACATQAILSILMNIQTNGAEGISLGEELTNFKEFTRDLPPKMKGLAISNCETIRKAHNSFAVADRVVFEREDDKPITDDDDVFHFTAYAPIEGVLYELDGLKPEPIQLGEVPTEEGSYWTDLALPIIQRRIERYKQGEIHFNLMALVRNRKDVINEEIEELNAKKLSLSGGDTSDEAKAALVQIEQEIADKEALLAVEDEKMRKMKSENVRRKWDYFPFIANLLKALAESGDLEVLLEQAAEEQERKESESK